MIGLQTDNFGPTPVGRHVTFGFRDYADALPDAVTPLKVAFISPSGTVYSAYLAVQRGHKTVRNYGSRITFPDDFLTAGGSNPQMERGPYAVLVTTLGRRAVECAGFVGGKLIAGA